MRSTRNGHRSLERERKERKLETSCDLNCLFCFRSTSALRCKLGDKSWLLWAAPDRVKCRRIRLSPLLRDGIIIMYVMRNIKPYLMFYEMAKANKKQQQQKKLKLKPSVTTIDL